MNLFTLNGNNVGMKSVFPAPKELSDPKIWSVEKNKLKFIKFKLKLSNF